MAFPTSRVLQIAKVCYEANRAWQEANGEKPDPTWTKASEAQINETVELVNFHFNNPLAGDAATHLLWLKSKEDEGWKWGKTYDEEAKTDPALVGFHLLPPERQARERLFVAIVKALSRV